MEPWPAGTIKIAFNDHSCRRWCFALALGNETPWPAGRHRHRQASLLHGRLERDWQCRGPEGRALIQRPGGKLMPAVPTTGARDAWISEEETLPKFSSAPAAFHNRVNQDRHFISIC